MADLRADVSGDLRGALEALRGVLADSLEAAEPDKRAPLAKQLHDVIVRLASLPVAKGSVTDDLKAKRAARQASVAKRAARSEQRRSGGGRARS